MKDSDLMNHNFAVYFKLKEFEKMESTMKSDMKWVDEIINELRKTLMPVVKTQLENKFNREIFEIKRHLELNTDEELKRVSRDIESLKKLLTKTRKEFKRYRECPLAR